MGRFFRTPIAAILVLVPLCALPSQAALGEPEASVQFDRERLQASDRVIAHSSYSVHQMATPAGTTIRQFVSPSGNVFAVAWEGTSPDLHQLLGSRFDEYLAAVQAMHSRRGRGVHIDTGDMVVDTGGHMGFVQGRAFLKSAMPQEVKADEIR